MKRVLHGKSATWKKYNTKKVQHGKSATRKKRGVATTSQTSKMESFATIVKGNVIIDAKPSFLDFCGTSGHTFGNSAT